MSENIKMLELQKDHVGEFCCDNVYSHSSFPAKHTLTLDLDGAHPSTCSGYIHCEVIENETKLIILACDTCNYLVNYDWNTEKVRIDQGTDAPTNLIQ
jgi:hypothetical protein